MFFISKVSRPLLLTLVLSLFGNNVCAQQTSKGAVKGILVETGTQIPTPFIHAALYNTVDSVLLGGVSSENGRFRIGGVSIGKYILKFTSVAYLEKTIGLNVVEEDLIDLDTLWMTPVQIGLQEVIISGERTKVTPDVDKTVFQINRKMLDISSTGVDLLKLLPGIVVDLMQNISVEGNSNVIILVNGMERDGKYLLQLQAADIEKIETMTNPPARYEGSTARVINVILKSGRDKGVSGNINFEAPASRVQIYSFPSARLSYGRNKTDAFASYSGSFAYFNIQEKTSRKIFGSEGVTGITSYRNVRQKNWSHRFNYGVDFALNKRNYLNFYGYINPYSQEHDGNAEMVYEGRTTPNWKARKEDYDRNNSSFYSLFYKHTFGKIQGHEFTIDASVYRLQAKNENVFTDITTGNVQTNLIRPGQNSLNVRADYVLPIKTMVRITTGFQTKLHRMIDSNSQGFKYVGTSQAVHAGFRFSKGKLVTEASLRLERATLDLLRIKSNTYFTFLPNLIFQYRSRGGTSMKVNYQKSLEYPGLYQINPYVVMEDPLTTRSGNSSLKPVHITNTGIEYNRTFGKNWIAIRTFYTRKMQVINGLSRLGNSGVLDTQLFNLGRIEQFGSQLTGSFSLGQAITAQSYFKIFRAFSSGNTFAIEQGLKNRQIMAYETSLSVNASLPQGLAISVQFSYNSPMLEVQKTVFCDPLYFISLNKTFAKVFRTGLTLAFPFGRTFTYQGDEISTSVFTNYSRRVIHLSMFPIIAKVSYNFNKGTERKQQESTKGDIYVKPGKGF